MMATGNELRSITEGIGCTASSAIAGLASLNRRLIIVGRARLCRRFPRCTASAFSNGNPDAMPPPGG
jgi:hypothetical protein